MQCQRSPAPSSVEAWHVNGRLVVMAQGEHATSCWTAAIHQSNLDVVPPEFSVESCRTSELCIQVISPYNAVAEFPLESPPKEILVRAEGFDQTVEVSTPVERQETLAGGEYVATVLGHDVGAAMAAAARRVPAGPGDTGRAVKIEDIFYSDGGGVGPQTTVRVSDRRATST